MKWWVRIKKAITGRTVYVVNNSTRMKKVAPPPPPTGAFSAKPAQLTNGDLRRQSSHEPPLTAPLPMSSVPGEDCAFDELLEGRMDLEVVLPDNKRVHMTVDRRTPMMDLLVHTATTNKISPGGHIIKVISKEEHNILYKPNTPIGTLDVNTVYIVPKPTTEIPVKRMPKLANQPFEQTFRLQVNLPRNQRMVLRVSPRITLAELKRQICNEKELDQVNHHLVHPAQPDAVLDLNSTLDDYGCAEISLMSNSGLRDSIRNTATHRIAYPRVEEEKKMNGILRLFSRKKRESSETRNGISSRGVSPTRSVPSRDSYQPKQSTKRKPAPAPPSSTTPSPPLVIQSSSSINSRPESEVSAKTDELGSTVSHSRHSSDSSGYHEPSVFSDCSENKSPEASIVHGGNVLSGHDSNSCKDVPDSLSLTKHASTPVKDSTNLKTVPSCSSTSIVSATRKRKAPQPPAPILPEVETPSSPEDQPSITIVTAQVEYIDPKYTDNDDELVNSDKERLDMGELERDARARESTKTDKELLLSSTEESTIQDSEEQERAALQFFENVLKESEMPDPICTSSNSSTKCSNPADNIDDTVQNRELTDTVLNTKAEFSVEAEMEPCISEGCVETSVPASVPSIVPADDLPTPNPVSDTSKVPSVPFNEATLSQVISEDYEKESVLEICSGESQSDHIICDSQSPMEVHCEHPIKMRDSSSSPIQWSPTSKSPKEVANSSDSKNPLHVSTEQKFVPNQTDCDPPIDCNSRVRSPDTDSESVASPATQKRLVNFAMGCYKSEERDIYSEGIIESSTNTMPSSKTISDLRPESISQYSVPQTRHKRQTPSVKIVPFEERSMKGIRETTDCDILKGQVHLRCTELSGMSTLPLTGRSASLYSLSRKKWLESKHSSTISEPTSLDSLKRTQSDQNLSQEMPNSVEENSDFVQEQNRLQDEYLKLQAQFITWQKQLLNNQSLLQNEKIVPEMSFPELEQYKIELENLPVILQKARSSEEVAEIIKTRSLPRQKSRPLSLKEISKSTTPLVNKNSTTKIEINSTQVTEEPSVRLKYSNKTVVNHNGINSNFETVEETPTSEQHSKSQTLPRPITRPASALETSRTMTLNRQVRPKSQIVSVTIGSWQQRNQDSPNIDSASVASSRSMFQSLENIPVEHGKSIAPVPVQRRKTRPVDISSNISTIKEDKQHITNTQKETFVKRIVTADDQKISRIESQRGTGKNEPIPHRSEKPVRAAEQTKQPKIEKKSPASDSSVHIKPTKPLVRLSSMKDEVQHPPALHVLKKWPLPEIKEKEAPVKVEKRSVWEEIKATTRRSGEAKERVTRAEVDLRKNRTKVQISSTTPKSREPEQRNDETNNAASKIHITKVNIYSSEANKNSSSSTSTGSTSLKTAQATPVKEVNKNSSKTVEKKGTEPFNNELKQVLLKRASSIVESNNIEVVEPTYAEAKDSQNDRKPENTVVNGNSPPPPPPPPVSTMPVIPPAVPIPKSSQLLMGKKDKGTAKRTEKTELQTMPGKDPREELMLEIRGFGGRKALRKAPATPANWNMKVYGSTSAVNS